MAKKSFSSKKFIKGLVVGGIIGGGAALLLAPKSGKETQDELKNSINDTLDLLKKFKTDLANVQENQKKVAYLSQTLLPENTQSLEKNIDQFKFADAPRVAIIKEQLNKISKEINRFDDKMNEIEEKSAR